MVTRDPVYPRALISPNKPTAHLLSSMFVGMFHKMPENLDELDVLPVQERFALAQSE